MNLMRSVAEAIIDRGEASVDDIAPLFPERTRKQILKAIENAKYHGLISLLKRAHAYGNHEGWVYGPYRESVKPTASIRSIASVWDLGAMPFHG